MSKGKNKTNLYSYHVFLFPFSWNYTKGMENASLEEKTELGEFIEALVKRGEWEKLIFKPNTILNYNEFNYFYDFARDILYDRGNGDTLISHLQHTDFLKEEKEFRFEVFNRDGENHQYALKIDNILLHLYSTGVGVLSFHLMNRSEKQRSEADILKINQFGRRLFPPFYDLDEDTIGTQEQFRKKEFIVGLTGTKKKELACWVDLGDESFREDFQRFTGDNAAAFQGFWLPKFFQQLFPSGLLTVDKENKKSLVYISPVLDDRMFVVCWYGNDGLVEKLKPKKLKTRTAYPHLSNEFWYKFIFVDVGLKTCQNDNMTEEALETSTNARWVNFGTLYGASRYSFACLTNELETLKKTGINSAFLVTHVQTIYYKIVELVLVQRACLLRFADEVTELSNLSDTEDLTSRVSNLYKQYIRFVNKIYFREVTAQEQGIELYDLLQQKMRIERDVKELNGEIQELHQYALLLEEQKRREQEEIRNNIDRERKIMADKLNTNIALIAAIFAVPAFITGFLGMNIFNDRLEYADLYWLVFVFMMIVLAVPLTFKALSGKWLLNWQFAAVAFCLLIVMILPMFNPRKPNVNQIETQFLLPDSLLITSDSLKWVIPLKDVKMESKGTISEPKN